MSSDQNLTIRTWMRGQASATHHDSSQGMNGRFYKVEFGRVLSSGTTGFSLVEGMKPEDLNKPPYVTVPHVVYEHVRDQNDRLHNRIDGLIKQIARYEHLIDKDMKKSRSF